MTDSQQHALAQAERERDRRMRRRLLGILHDGRANGHGGWMSAAFIRDVLFGVRPGLEGVLDDEHLVELMADLVAKDFVTSQDTREFTWQVLTLDDRQYHITALGSSLMMQSIPADPDIEDDRITH